MSDSIKFSAVAVTSVTLLARPYPAQSVSIRRRNLVNDAIGFATVASLLTSFCLRVTAVQGQPDLDTPTWVKLSHVEGRLGSGTRSMLDLDTPTWVKSHVEGRRGSVTRSMLSVHSYVAPPVATGCAMDGVYFGAEFSFGCGDKDEFSGTPGSNVLCTDTSFSSFDRNSTLHGAQLDLKNFRHCLEKTPRLYLLTARVRLTGNLMASGNPTECATSGKNCLKIQHHWMDASFTRSKSPLWEETQALGAKQGKTLTIATSISFDPKHLEPTNVFQLIELIGPSSHMNIEIEEFNFYLPPPRLFPEPGKECSSLAPVNNKGEAGDLTPYPFYVTPSRLFATIEEDPQIIGNNFFKVRGRDASIPERAGLAWAVDLECLHEGAILIFQAKVRRPIGVSIGSLVLKPYLRAEFDSGSSASSLLASCPVVDRSKWVQCEGSLTLPTSFIAASVRKLYVVLGATPGLDYDIDDIFLTIKGTP